MARNRQRIHQCGISGTWDGQAMGYHYPLYHGTPYPYPADSVWKSEVIVDEIDPGDTKKTYNSVSHTVIRAGTCGKHEFSFRNYLGSLKHLYHIQERFVYTDFPSLPALSLPWGDLVDDLSADVDGKIETKTLIGVSVKEALETYRMIRNPFGLLKKGWRRKVGHLTMAEVARKKAKLASNLFLEGIYGWKALFYDWTSLCDSIIKLDAAITADAARNSSVRRVSKQYTTTLAAPAPSVNNAEWNTYQSWGPYVNSGAGGFHRFVYEPTKVKAMVTCESVFDDIRQKTGLPSLLDVLGLEPRDVLPTMWEMVPFSFVVDWFVNTRPGLRIPDSGVLNSVHVRKMGFSVKTEQRANAQFMVTGFPASDGSYPVDTGFLSDRPGSNYYETVTPCIKTQYTRTRGFPLGEQFWKFKGLSVSRSLSGLALIIQRVLK